MRRTEHAKYADCQPPRPQRQDPYPEFENYVGGDCFTYEGIGYRWQRGLGAGRYGKVALFKSDSYTQSRVVPLQPSFFVVKIEKGGFEYGKWRYGEGSQFHSEAAWNQEVYDLGVFAGDPAKNDQPHAVLMKYIEGVTLEHVTPRSMAEMATIFIGVVAAIQHLHQTHNMVHGDIKSPNIIYGKDGKYYPIDFGLAERRGKKNVGAYEVPQLAAGKTLESVFPHIAPECFGSKLIEADITQDVYALGYLLRCLTLATLKNCGVLPLESLKSYRIVKLLRGPNPTDRLLLDRAASMLHLAFLSSVPRLPDCVKAPKEEKEAIEHTPQREKDMVKTKGGRTASAPATFNRSALFVRLPAIAQTGRAQNSRILTNPSWKF
jgi:serine/threonine protein kinase